jgi:hypothetical protein
VDRTDPTGNISGMPSSLTAGEKINYQISASDNQALTKIRLTITDASNNRKVDEAWNSSNKRFSTDGVIDTKGWRTGIHYYTLWVKDAAGNQNGSDGKHGSFKIKEATQNRPIVSNITPTSATLNRRTSFTVTGKNLTSSTAFHIDECANIVSSSGNSQRRIFECTPRYSRGNHSGVVKDRSGGKTLKKFNVNFR